MSLQPECDRSMRTGVRSARMGKTPPGDAWVSSGRTRKGWSRACPVRNIQRLPRSERTAHCTCAASIWNPCPWHAADSALARESLIPSRWAASRNTSAAAA